jgi:hypothetical protein
MLIAVVIPNSPDAMAKETLAPAGGPQHSLVDGDGVAAVIVLPRRPDELETYAAEEFQKYVKAITGKTLPIIREPDQPKGYGIWIGRTEAAESADFTLTEARLGRDGYAAEAGVQGLILVGRCPFGTVLGVYDIIEREFGVRWCAPDEYRLYVGDGKFQDEKSGIVGEVIPAAETLSIGTFRREFKPSFRYRWVRSSDWSLKQRMNVQVTVNGKTAGVNWKWHFHTFCILIPPDKYFDDHPQWFPLIKGKRQRSTRPNSHSTQLCTSNPEVVERLSEGLIEVLDGDPTIEIITLSPNDGGGFCECPNCKALDEPDSGFFNRYSKRLAILNQQVAQRVATRHPKVSIKVGAYVYYALPPKIEGYRPEPNLLIQLCHCYACHNHLIDSDQCTPAETYEPAASFMPNRRFAELVEQWAELTDNLFIYEYYALWAWGRNKILWPMVHTMRHDIPWYRDLGVKGFYTQCVQMPWTRCPLNHYIAAKLAWNADLDVDWLIDDFCESFFEDAASPMKHYLLGLEAAFVRNNQCISTGLRGGQPGVLGPKIFDEATRDQLRAWLDEADQRANSDVVRGRIAAIRGGFNECEQSVLKMMKRN